MRTSNIIVRAASIGLFALGTILFSGYSAATNNGDSKSPGGTVGSGTDSSGGGRSEDGIGTGPIIASGGYGAGFGVALPTLSLSSLIVTVQGSGSTDVQDDGKGTSLVQFSGNMSFQLSSALLNDPSVKVTLPSGNVQGKTVALGSALFFVQNQN